MSNIEIHGVNPGSAQKMRRRIFELFQDKPYVDELVVTLYPTTCYDKIGLSRPFIRVVNSCQSHSDEIISVLEMLGIDIEHLVLEKFVPKDKGDIG